MDLDHIDGTDPYDDDIPPPDGPEEAHEESPFDPDGTVESEDDQETEPSRPVLADPRSITLTAIEPAYQTLDEFVSNYLCDVVEVPLSTQSGKGPLWDRTWWRHPSVVARLRALWGAWEGARVSNDPAAMSTWFIHHLDPHMKVLMGEQGPMSGAPDPYWTGHPRLEAVEAPRELSQACSWESVHRRTAAPDDGSGTERD